MRNMIWSGYNNRNNQSICGKDQAGHLSYLSEDEPFDAEKVSLWDEEVITEAIIEIDGDKVKIPGKIGWSGYTFDSVEGVSSK